VVECERELSPRRTKVLTALGFVAVAISFAASVFSGWLLLLIFPLAYVALLVRTW
jgi:hypothetical protein